MDLSLSRRSFGKLVAGTTAGAACLQLGRSAAFATSSSSYRAMVGIFLAGGNDGWNMIVPSDAPRYSAYQSARGTVALPTSSLTPLPGSNYALNSALAPLLDVWQEGALGLVLNTGSLSQPLTKAQYLASPDVRPLNLMSHGDEQEHWMGMRMRDSNPDGFMGRLGDRTAQSSLPSLISFAGGNLAQVGKTSSPLWLDGSVIAPDVSTANSADPAAFARSTAMSTMSDTTGSGQITATTGGQITSAYAQIGLANTVLANSTIDHYFDGLSSGLAQQLMRVARMIAAHDTLGQSRQTFFAQTGGFDTHTSQVSAQRGLLTDIGLSLKAFYSALKALGLASNVTTFTMSDFGRVYVGNAQYGADHAWGNNHLVMGAALKPQTVAGTYPSQVLGGPDDIVGDGRFLPTVAIEEYVGAIAKWHGVADSDMPYVFPNWATWSTNGRGPISIFA